MRERTWPDRSDGSHFTALPLDNMKEKKENEKPQLGLSSKRDSSKFPRKAARFCSRLLSSSSSSSPSPSPLPPDHHDFSTLPYDVLTRIAASLNHPSLQAASLVCKSWKDALRPLREAMLFLRLGKGFKHGRGGVRPNLNKALECFLKGAALGSSLAMVDAGLVYWEMGKKEEGIALYRKAAEIGDRAGQCNLGISYLQVKPPQAKEAIKWLYEASVAGHVRAQYQLALCLHQGCGVDPNLAAAARWYLKAAKGGYVRAMYNTALCYSSGEGLVRSHRRARKWMKRAADHGHSKAQFEHGLSLFLGKEMVKALVYLELATRAGETAATHVSYVILQELPAFLIDRAMFLADKWRALPSSR
ncbi:hypothetical protein F0562_033270 [Nyssa sinensis]|uniref:F-box domain-containing protein n=1 Tax=Nyssa sinensis TaxID=561372 RepID=A0A5J5AUS7_9ASTE|nr:hypothetical protein F0562_033270 [Nyssa sinensis]